MRSLRMLALLAVTVAVGGCHSGLPATPQVTKTPSPSVTQPTSPSALAPSPPIPDARSVAVASLLQPELHAKKVLYTDLDGAPPEEIVVWSKGGEIPGSIAQRNDVEIFGWREGRWDRIFEATTSRPRIIDPNLYLQGAVQGIALLQAVAFTPGHTDLAVAVQVQGGTQGPLNVYVLRETAGKVSVVFQHATQRGGLIAASGHMLELVTGAYGSSDGMCCPSRDETDVIGAKEGRLQILSRSFRSLLPVFPTPLPAASVAGTVWGVYVAVAPPGSPQLDAAVGRLRSIGMPSSAINSFGSLACDGGAPEALGVPATDAAVAVYYRSRSDAEALAAALHPGPAGIALVTIGCND